MIGANDNSYGTPNVGMGAVDDDNDLHGTFYVAVDNDYLYIAAEILDDVVVDDQASGWWTSDVVQVCIGLYDQRGPKHVGMQRGEEPDIKCISCQMAPTLIMEQEHLLNMETVITSMKPTILTMLLSFAFH